MMMTRDRRQVAFMFTASAIGTLYVVFHMLGFSWAGG